MNSNLDGMTTNDYDDAEYAAPLRNRMIVALTALVGIVISVYTLMFKLGLIGDAFCTSGGCETVQMSPWATQLGIPVPVWGLAGYGAMMIIALMGLQPKYAEARWVSALLLAGATFALIFTGYLSYLEANKIHAWCKWCLGSAANVVIMFLATLIEMKRLRAR
jgi:uncharacterized membrane protein